MNTSQLTRNHHKNRWRSGINRAFFQGQRNSNSPCIAKSQGSSWNRFKYSSSEDVPPALHLPIGLIHQRVRTKYCNIRARNNDAIALITVTVAILESSYARTIHSPGSTSDGYGVPILNFKRRFCLGIRRTTNVGRIFYGISLFHSAMELWFHGTSMIIV